MAKHQRLAELLLELMARKTIESTNSLVDKYKAIQRRLNKLPASIEELTELREYMGGIYTQLGELKPLLTQTLANFGVLDSVEYKLDRGAFLLKWEVFAWPKDILQKVRRLVEGIVELLSRLEPSKDLVQTRPCDRLLDCIRSRQG